MNENAQNDNKKAPNLEEQKTEEKNNFVSFSEINKDGKFIEAYGYFKKDESAQTLDERVNEIARRLGKN